MSAGPSWADQLEDEERAAGAEKLPEGLDAAQVARLAAQSKRMQQSDSEDED